MQQIFIIFLPQEAGAFGNNTGKEPQNPRPKLENTNTIYLLRILLCLQSNASGSFLQKCINFVEQRLEFSHFEATTIHKIFEINSSFHVKLGTTGKV